MTGIDFGERLEALRELVDVDALSGRQVEGGGDGVDRAAGDRDVAALFEPRVERDADARAFGDFLAPQTRRASAGTGFQADALGRQRDAARPQKVGEFVTAAIDRFGRDRDGDFHVPSDHLTPVPRCIAQSATTPPLSNASGESAEFSRCRLPGSNSSMAPASDVSAPVSTGISNRAPSFENASLPVMRNSGRP